MLQPIVDVAESVSVSEYFRFADGVGRAKIECYIRHKTTRHLMVGSYRQLVTYRGDKIERLEEFHDGAKMIAFWEMISGEAAIEKTPAGGVASSLCPPDRSEPSAASQ